MCALRTVLSCVVIILVFQLPSSSCVKERCWSWGACTGWFAIQYKCYTKVQPIPIPDEYKWLVQTACPKLALSNYTCCPKSRLMELYKYDTMLRNKYFLSLCPHCLYNIMNFLCDIVCGLDGEKYRLLADGRWQSQSEYYDLIVAWRYIRDTYRSCKNIRLPNNNMPLLDHMCGQHDHYSCSPLRLFYNLPEWENVTHIRSFYRYIFNRTVDNVNSVDNTHEPYSEKTYSCSKKIQVTDKTVDNVKSMDNTHEPYSEKTYSCSKRIQVTDKMPVYNACKCRDCPTSCPVSRDMSITVEEEPQQIEQFALIANSHNFRIMVYSIYAILAVLFTTGFLSIYFCRGQDVSLEHFEKNQEGHIRMFKPLQDSPLRDELANVDQFDDQFGVCYRQFIVRLGGLITDRSHVFFDWWGRLWGRFPGVAMFIGLSLVVALSHGVNYLRISTDPEEYMVGTSDRSHLERTFFESNFEPLFRINTIIVHVKRIRYFEYSKATVVSDPRKVYYFGPAFNDSILLKIKNLTESIQKMKATLNNNRLRYRDFCFDPYRSSKFKGPFKQDWQNRCQVNSVWAWFQNNVTEFEKMRANKSYLDRIIRCTDFPDHIDCLPTFGRTVHPAHVLGGYLKPKAYLEDKKANYLKANTHIIQFVFNNHNDPVFQKNVYEWEKAFTNYMSDWVELYQPPYFDVAYCAHSAHMLQKEDSPHKMDYIQNAYFFEFLLLALSWSTFSKVSRLVVDTRFMTAAGAVGIIYGSITAASGLMAYVDGMGTEINQKMLPVLMMALGANNIQLFAAIHWREKMKADETVWDHSGRVLAQLGGAFIYNSLLESIVLAFNRQSSVPTIYWFAIFSTTAVVINFIVMMTFGIGMFHVDRWRYLRHRFDILICIKAKAREQSVGGDGIIYKLFKYGYTPILMHAYTRCIVMVAFFGWLASSLAVIPGLKVAPSSHHVVSKEDTFILKYHTFSNRYVHIGPAVHFVITEGFDISHPKLQDIVGMQRWSTDDSIVNMLYQAHLNPSASMIALPPTSWFDDFIDWLKVEECCRVFPGNGTFCPNDFTGLFNFSQCVPCNVTHHLRTFGSHDARIFFRPRFRKYVHYFIRDHASKHCIKGGMPQHERSVNMLFIKNRASIKSFYFTTYFVSLHSNEDKKLAMHAARTLATNITSMLDREMRVRPPGDTNTEPVVMYAMAPYFLEFDQFNTMWIDLLTNIGWTLLSMFVATFLLLGLDLFTAVAFIVNHAMCVCNILAFLYWNDFPLNAYTCIFLTMSQAMFVAFGSFLAHVYGISSGPSRVHRAADAITEAGPTLLTGTTIGKFPATILFFTNFEAIYRNVGLKIYLFTVLIGALHGLIFMPVLLSFIGSARNRQKVIYHMKRKCERDVCPETEYDVKSKLYLEPFDFTNKSNYVPFARPKMSS